MQSLTHQKPHGGTLARKWLRRACATGFVFFLAKGLVWIAAAVWVIY